MIPIQYHERKTNEGVPSLRMMQQISRPCQRCLDLSPTPLPQLTCWGAPTTATSVGISVLAGAADCEDSSDDPCRPAGAIPPPPPPPPSPSALIFLPPVAGTADDTPSPSPAPKQDDRCRLISLPRAPSNNMLLVPCCCVALLILLLLLSLPCLPKATAAFEATKEDAMDNTPASTARTSRDAVRCIPVKVDGLPRRAMMMLMLLGKVAAPLPLQQPAPVALHAREVTLETVKRTSSRGVTTQGRGWY